MCHDSENSHAGQETGALALITSVGSAESIIPGRGPGRSAVVTAVSRDHEPPPALGLQAVLAHQATDFLGVHDHPSMAKLCASAHRRQRNRWPRQCHHPEPERGEGPTQAALDRANGECTQLVDELTDLKRRQGDQAKPAERVDNAAMPERVKDIAAERARRAVYGRILERVNS